MRWEPLLLIVVAACFSIGGDIALKQFGDHRRTADLVWCLALWEGCALSWVLAYLWRLPLGRPTAFGLLLVLTLNCGVGIVWYDETFTLGQWLGLALGVVSVLLLAFG